MIHYSSIRILGYADFGRWLPTENAEMTAFPEPIVLTPGATQLTPVIETTTNLPGAGYAGGNNLRLYIEAIPADGSPARTQVTTIDIVQNIVALEEPNTEISSSISEITNTNDNNRSNITIQTNVPNWQIAHFNRTTGHALLNFTITGVIAPATNENIVNYILLGTM